MTSSSSNKSDTKNEGAKVKISEYLHKLFDENIGVNNTRLHLAILGNFNPESQQNITKHIQRKPAEIFDQVRKILMMDKKLVELGGKSIINEKAFENTALSLAIKHGLIDVALQILNHPHVDVNIRDKRGLSPLQMACMLRNDSLIQKLLEKGAKLDGIPHPAQLYYYQPTASEINNLKGIATAKYSAGGYMYSFAEGPTDRSLDIAWEQKPPLLNSYADFFIFYMQAILRNMSWLPEDEKAFDQAANQDRTEDIFRKSYIMGMPHFWNMRAQIPVSQSLLSKLGNQSLLAEIPQPTQNQIEKVKGTASVNVSSLRTTSSTIFPTVDPHSSPPRDHPTMQLKLKSKS